MWLGLSQSVEDLRRRRLRPTEEKGVLSPDCLWTRAATSALPVFSSLLSFTAEYGVVSSSNYMSQFLKINLSLSLSLSLYIYIHTHSPIGSVFWRSLTNTHNKVFIENYRSKQLVCLCLTVTESCDWRYFPFCIDFKSLELNLRPSFNSFSK